ncbi:hypothetical protein GGR58DRAFT_505101 [Xylaria digitata]|nr:hypothetical protein GGR58DRAFT_505101 [Xylaria digitata]
MAQEATHHSHSTSKCSRCRRRHRHSHRHDARHCDDEDQNSASFNTKGQSASETAENPVPGVSTWSEPVLDIESNGRFQYRFRETPEAYEWAISGSDSGIYPQYLSVASEPTIVRPLDTCPTYLLRPYAPNQNIQSQQQAYDPSNGDTGPSAPVADKGDGDRKDGEDKRPSHGGSKPRRDKSSNDHRNEKRSEKHHHRNHGHHRDHSSHHRRHHHHRTKSHEDGNREKYTGWGYSRASSHEKVNDWLYSFEYTI